MRPDKLFIVLALVIAMIASLEPGVAQSFPGEITTVAGTGSAGNGGDGGPATSARLRDPAAVAVDAGGNLFVADAGNHRIRRVAASDGEITTIAGSGARGYSGDGGPATDAALDSPQGVAVDGQGNVFLADTDNHCVRRVDAATGIITTVAGNGSQGYAGDGGPATGASLAGPRGVAIDASGRIFIADTGNHRVRRVDLSANIQTIAGTSSGGYSGDDGPATSAKLQLPSGLAFDPSGDLYVADTDNDRVRKIELPAGTIRTVAGNGTSGYGGDGQGAQGAKLKKPRAVALDAARHLYIADTENHRVRRVEHGTGIITTIAGTGLAGYNGDGIAATTARLRVPTGVAADGNGGVIVADTENHRARRIEEPPFAACGNGQVESGEACDGGATSGDCCSSTCQLEAAGTGCRAAVDSCDQAEVCSGASSSCPADALRLAGEVCRAAAGPCDLAETCSGVAVTCPADQVKAAGVTCSAGDCAAPATCNGIATSCPAITLLAAGTLCRAIAGLCDVAESCTGSAPACPNDGFASAATTCRTAAEPCDLAESCTGTSASCPNNALAGGGTVCRPPVDACDAGEQCNGSTASCPADALATSGSVCRPAAGACDAAETCSGSSTACPADALASAGVECRAETGPCDPAEQCSGASTQCPGDVHLPDGLVCDDQDPETTGEACLAGACCGGDDLDEDGLLDGCDPEEAPLAVDRLSLRVGQLVLGRVIGKGSFAIEQLGGNDILDITDGLTVRVLDALDATLVLVSFLPEECEPGNGGGARCKTLNRSSTARFKRRVLDDGSAELRFKLRLGALDLPGPLTPPVRLVISAARIDRVGEAPACSEESWGLRCGLS